MGPLACKTAVIETKSNSQFSFLFLRPIVRNQLFFIATLCIDYLPGVRIVSVTQTASEGNHPMPKGIVQCMNF